MALNPAGAVRSAAQQAHQRTPLDKTATRRGMTDSPSLHPRKRAAVYSTNSMRIASDEDARVSDEGAFSLRQQDLELPPNGPAARDYDPTTLLTT